MTRKVEIRDRRTLYRGRYRVDEIIFDADRAAGPGRLLGVKREVFERGDSVAALIHDIDRDMIILTEQFRVATHDKGPGYIIEAMAGSLEEGEQPEACIRREMMEETGYRAGKLVALGHVYASPGSSSERLFLFYAPVREADLVDPDASGVVGENEDVRRVELPRDTFLEKLEACGFEDAKLVMLGWWLRSRPRRGKPAQKERRTVRG